MSNPFEAKVSIFLPEDNDSSWATELFLLSTFNAPANVEHIGNQTIVSIRIRVDYMTVEQIIDEVNRRIGATKYEYVKIAVTLEFPNLNPSQTQVLWEMEPAAR